MPKCLTDVTKQILKTAAPGYETLSTVSYFADEIVEEYKEFSDNKEDLDLGVALFVEKVLQQEPNIVGDMRWWFHAGKFVDLIDNEDAAEEVASIVICMADFDLGLGAALYEADERVSENIVRSVMDELRALVKTV